LLALLTQVLQQYYWRCHAACLMENHDHLVIATPQGHLSHGMRQGNGLSTPYDNRRQGQAGHGFQGRYQAIVMESDRSL
jgi:hypothetical protein